MWTLLTALLMLSQASFVTSPENCLQKTIYPCAVLTKGKTTLSHAGNSFSTSGNSILSFSAPQEAFIVRGSFWATTKNSLKIKTSYGSFSTTSITSEFWLNA
ncbi:MAG: hypothetical protein IT287_04455, partial [Bdellovibrionaceae bacterium]|nr:hypothetical protein [Pseudobdellovibrionaceae bacterium]